MTSTAPLLQMSGVSKAFPGVLALDDVSLEVRGGEVLGLVGENGAGKSTLIRILAGAHLPDGGSISMDGHSVRFPDPVAAMQAGIGVIYQEFNLIPALTASENLFLGREGVLLQQRVERQRASEVFQRLEVDVPLNIPCGRLSVARQQLVEIARVLLGDVRLLVMDEPTAALTPREVRCLMDIIRELKSRGIGIVYVSHRLDEVFEIADTIAVLRDGRHITTRAAGQLSREELIEAMVGRSLRSEYPQRSVNIGAVRLRVDGLRRVGAVEPTSFHVCEGEILGITGLVGSGRTELLRLIFGADMADSGTMELDGHPLIIRSPREAIHAGLCLLTEDRKSEGLIPRRSVQENFSIASLPTFSRFGFIRCRQERSAFAGFVDSLRIRLASFEQAAAGLSGGNQQKVLLARWLQRNAHVIIFDEPTRGIDVGARHEIYRLMNSLVAVGKSIVMVTSELPEALGMSDRILVMHAGRVVGEVADVASATPEQLMNLAIGRSGAAALPVC